MRRATPLIVRLGRRGSGGKMLRGEWQAYGVMRIKHLEGAADDRAKPR